MPAIAARASARQLDIISDTALSADPRLTPKAQCIVKRDAEGQKHSASSSVDPRVSAIERRRQAASITHAALCRLAGIELRNWHKLRAGTQTPAARTIVKLQIALDGRPKSTPPQVILSFHRLVMQALAARMKFDLETLLATDFSVQRPSNPQWLRAARIRQMAIYIVAVELQVSNADLGRALGDTRANIKFARDAIEDRREDGNEIDQALTAVTLQVRAE